MYLSVISLPVLGSIISGFFGRKVGVSGAQTLTTSSIMITTLLAIVLFFEIGFNNFSIYLELFRWIDSESFNVLWSFNFDSLTVSMLIPVLIVSCLVHLYSVGYMSHDPHNQRFFSYLSLFTFMMVILVTSNNFLLMFVGWEGVGICSYLLVSFWFTRIAANQSSISALLTNRVGDCFLTIGMFALLWSFGNIDYYTIFSLSPFISENIITIAGICLLIGAMAKSSQVGLHVWLPMAMEGPTPVSALIHAATMVTAGVYLLMRNSPLIEYSETILITCIWVGGITTVFSSLIGLFQQDIKKVIAYSTMSQLGMMVIAVGLSSYGLALFHLVNHAFYKALLFLGAGSVIHAVHDNQDFRKYGGLIKFLPLTYSVMLIASLSLVAFPFMTGFYSKDMILESSYGHFSYSGVTVYFIAIIGAMFTTLYSVKVLYLTFISNPSAPINSYRNAHESDVFMSLPLIILAILSIFFGYIAKDIFIGMGTGFFIDNSLFIHPDHEIMLDTEFAVPLLFKLLPFFFTVNLTIISILILEFIVKYVIIFKLSNLGYYLYSFFNQRFYVELFYNRYITSVILKLGGQTTKELDNGSVEYIGPYGLEISLNSLSNRLAKLDTGTITSYALYILVGLISYIFIPSVLNNSILIVVVILLFGYLANLNGQVNNKFVKHNIVSIPFPAEWFEAIGIILTSAALLFLKTYCFAITMDLSLDPVALQLKLHTIDITSILKDIVSNSSCTDNLAGLDLPIKGDINYTDLYNQLVKAQPWLYQDHVQVYLVGGLHLPDNPDYYMRNAINEMHEFLSRLLEDNNLLIRDNTIRTEFEDLEQEVPTLRTLLEDYRQYSGYNEINTITNENVTQYISGILTIVAQNPQLVDNVLRTTLELMGIISHDVLNLRSLFDFYDLLNPDATNYMFSEVNDNLINISGTGDPDIIGHVSDVVNSWHTYAVEMFPQFEGFARLLIHLTNITDRVPAHSIRDALTMLRFFRGYDYLPQDYYPRIDDLIQRLESILDNMS